MQCEGRTSQVKLEQQPVPGDRSSLDGVRHENERSRWATANYQPRPSTGPDEARATDGRRPSVQPAPRRRADRALTARGEGAKKISGARGGRSATWGASRREPAVPHRHEATCPARACLPARHLDRGATVRVAAQPVLRSWGRACRLQTAQRCGPFWGGVERSWSAGCATTLTRDEPVVRPHTLLRERGWQTGVEHVLQVLAYCSSTYRKRRKRNESIVAAVAHVFGRSLYATVVPYTTVHSCTRDKLTAVLTSYLTPRARRSHGCWIPGRLVDGAGRRPQRRAERSGLTPRKYHAVRGWWTRRVDPSPPLRLQTPVLCCAVLCFLHPRGPPAARPPGHHHLHLPPPAIFPSLPTVTRSMTGGPFGCPTPRAIRMGTELGW